MPQEVIGDVTVAGADEMQHLDDRTVRRHRAAGRERYRDDGRNNHQRENTDSGEHGRAGHRCASARSRRDDRPRWPTAPLASRGYASAARSSLVPGASRATIMRGTGRSSSDSPLPSHGSSSLPDSSLVYGRTSSDARLLPRRDSGDRGYIALEIAAGARTHLDGDFARDLRLPFAQPTRCTSSTAPGRDRRQERHDRNNRHQRTACDRCTRHDRRHIARADRHLRAFAPEIHQRACVGRRCLTHRCAAAPRCSTSRRASY